LLHVLIHIHFENARKGTRGIECLKFDNIRAVFRFFGLGDNIVKWLNLLDNRRQACILMDGGLGTKFFDLETGCAQSDNLSSFIFNFCKQILIFKLELNPRISKLLGIFPGLLTMTGFTVPNLIEKHHQMNVLPMTTPSCLLLLKTRYFILKNVYRNLPSLVDYTVILIKLP
jgi:hypothetical protein